MTDTDGSAPLHLAIVGGGIAGGVAALWAAAQGAQVTLFNAGLPLGGTCIHVGTFPARWCINAATDYHRAAHPRFDGLHTTSPAMDWKLLDRQRQADAQAISQTQSELLNRPDNLTVINEHARFVGPSTLEAGGRRFEVDRVLLTPGSHSTWPDIDGLSEVNALSLGQLGDLPERPESMIFFEFTSSSIAYAQAFARMGTAVTIITTKPRLFDEYGSPDGSDLLAEILADDGVTTIFGAAITHAESRDDGVRLLGTAAGRPTHWDGAHLVIVNHRRPQVEELGLGDGGVALSDEQYIVIDETLQTTNPIVFAAGDAIGRGSHAYASAYDAVQAAYNALRPSRMAGHNTAVPFAIYSDPQFAGVGWDEARACAAGFEADSATCLLEEIPAARAMGYRRGFIKLIRDCRSNHLVGARIVAPNAAELIMELALALRNGLSIDELANLVRPPISLGEGIGRAAQQLIARS